MVCEMEIKFQRLKKIDYGRNHGFEGYCMNGHPLTSIDYRKDLGVTFDSNLKFHQHLLK